MMADKGMHTITEMGVGWVDKDHLGLIVKMGPGLSEDGVDPGVTLKFHLSSEAARELAGHILERLENQPL